MLSIVKANKNHKESIKQCFMTLFDEGELPYLEKITSFVYSYVALDRLNKVKAFILVKESRKYADYEIAYLGVSSRYRGQGYAKRLLKLVLERLSGHSVWLNTLDTNLEACSLYKKIGFKQFEIVETRCGRAIVYRLVIPNNFPHLHEVI